MPGLKQLQQFNSDIMTLGDEAKIRAARGEKPVTVSIPKNVQDIDDSDEFLNGLPMLSEEEQAQADAAQKEKERDANDFSEFLDDGKESKEEETSAPAAKQEEAVPDMSDLLPSGDDMDSGEVDLSDFEDKAPEPEVERAQAQPKEVAIEDMDLDSLLAFSEKPKEEPAQEEDTGLFGSDTEENTETAAATDDESDSLFGGNETQTPGQTFDSSLFDKLPENSEPAEPLPELDENSLMNSLGGVGNFNDEEPESPSEINSDAIPEAEEIPAAEEVPEAGDTASEEKTEEPENAEETFSTDEPVKEGEAFDADNFDFSLGADAGQDGISASEDFKLPEFEDSYAENNSADEILADDINVSAEPEAEDNAEKKEPEENAYYDGDLPDPNADFATTESLNLNDDLPTEFNEIPDIENIPQEAEAEDAVPAEENAEAVPESDAKETENADDIDLGGLDLLDLEDLNKDNPADEVNLNDIEIPEPEETKTEAANESAEEAPEETSSPEPSSEEVNESAGTEINPDEFSTDGMDDIPSFEDSSKDSEPASLESLSPEETVPEDSFGTGSFDTSDIKDLDFSNEGNSDFALGSLDGAEGDDEFSIPGFSDTETADLDKKPDVETPDFSGAAELNEKDKPKNTFTDAEYKRFLKNLATYPLNVRIALEDFVVKNEFTDDAIFAVLEKVLRKAPARQVATELEKLLDIPLDVPRDFERRSVAEYEAYKKSIEYQLKNKIIPGAILTTVAAVLVFCIFTFSNKFIYKPLRASSLYKQGYELLQDSQYPLSEERFNQALTFKPVKKWFYTYAEGYRDHRQYDRSRMMYKAILGRYDHEKKAGLDWAKMESEDLYNYEESERILKREVLDYHINDADALLALGDLYLEWATDSDAEKFPLAKQNYDLLTQLYGTNNLYLSRQMRYFIRTDNLRQVLMYKEIFMNQKKGLESQDEIELAGYMLDKRYGKLRPSEESLRSQIEDVRKLLERALKSAPENAVALYNMGRYFVATNSGKNAAKILQASIDSFEKQTKRNRRDTYKYINAYRLLGEEMCNENEYLTAETLYGRGIDIFERENASSRFESDENVGHLYADLADLDYFIAADNDAALMHYENAVNNKYDTSSVRYRIGYIQYQKQNYPAALGSFIKSHDTSGNDIHLLLALANTLSLSSDNYVARGYYERLISILDGERQKYGILLPQVRDDQGDIVDTYMKASNNLGVTLSRIAANTGDSSLNAKAIVSLQESLRAWDALTRNQKTMIRLEGSNLAEQNVRYITHPMPDYSPEIYTKIPRMLFGEEGLE